MVEAKRTARSLVSVQFVKYCVLRLRLFFGKYDDGSLFISLLMFFGFHAPVASHLCEYLILDQLSFTEDENDKA